MEIRRALIGFGAVAALGACSLAYDLAGYASGDGTTSEPEGGAASDAGELPIGDAAEPSPHVDASVPTVVDPDAGADGGCKGTAGPAMVRIGSYCIDATEVTAASYLAFAAAVSAGATPQPPECAFNHTFAPASPIAADDLPARFVDWCDALAYCKWAGKRLCGKVGGGPASYDDPLAAGDQWYGACSANGTRLFPYGGAYDGAACNDLDSNGDAGDPVAVQTHPRCVGGYPGLFDMSGNVREWQDACEAGNGDGTESCHSRGGGANAAMNGLRCIDKNGDARNYNTSEHVGFRCCSD